MKANKPKFKMQIVMRTMRRQRWRKADIAGVLGISRQLVNYRLANPSEKNLKSIIRLMGLRMEDIKKK